MQTKISVFQYVILWVVVAAFTHAEENEVFQEKFSKSTCSFTAEFLKHVAKKHNSTNIVFSPASVSILLSVLQQGAKKNTADQLEQILHLTAEESRMGYGNFTLLRDEKNVTFEWGNRCYVKQGIKFKDDFQGIIKKSFDFGVEELSFEPSSLNSSAELINNWVKKVTHNQITDLVDSSMLTPETIMLMINAVFFKGTWLSPFKKGKTAEDKFELSSDNSVQTLFMSQREKFYADKDSALGAKWIILPFQNRRFSMVFVLPTKKHRLNQLLEKLTGEDLHQMFTYRGVSQVKVRIPKFKLSEKVSLVDTLRVLGLTDIFSPASDLSGISAVDNLQVSEIIHQANIEIDEKGSTGSAATVIQFLRMRTPNLSFVANQPFLFFLIDQENNFPLFAGKVANPKS